MKKELPKKILEQAVRLRDPLKDVYITLYSLGKPSSAAQVANQLGKARAYINMRLNQLVDMGLVCYTKKGGIKLYSVVEKKASK